MQTLLVAIIIDREFGQYATSKFQKFFTSFFLHVNIHTYGDAVHVCLSGAKQLNLMTTNTPAMNGL